MNKFTEEHYWMRRAMREFGGSFVRSLAECLETADAQNYNKLEDAFREYVKEYMRGGEVLKARDFVEKENERRKN